MTVTYLGARVPQICKNLRRGTTVRWDLHWMQGEFKIHGSSQLQRKVLWVNGQHITDSGLSSGVKKVWKMVMSKGTLSKTDSKVPHQTNWKQQKLK